MATLSALQARFSTPAVRFEAGEGGLLRAVISTPLAEAEIYLHGAHVTRFVPGGQKPVLWLSGKSLFQDDKPIRGGVPLVFPWFGPRSGDASAPVHGFARLRQWSVDAVHAAPGGEVEVIFSLGADDQTREHWPHAFTARYHVRISQTLELLLRIRNDGNEPFSFEEALHTYFAVGDVRQARVTGLEGSSYVDKTDGMKLKPQGDEAVTISAETDRVYVSTRSTCVLHDPLMGREIQVAKEGSDSTVVWNPWIAKSKAMADFGDDEWPGMICIETCNVGEQKITLGAGRTHEMRAKIGVSRSSNP